LKFTSDAVSAIALAMFGLSACSPSSEAPAPAAEAAAVEAPAAPATAAPDVSQLPAGAYTTDPSHSTLIFHVSHLGFSTYTASFSKFTIDLQLDPAAPEKATVAATIDLASLNLPNPPAGFVDELLNPTWLDKATTPQMKFESTAITRTGPATADITGNFTLKGITKPVTLHATFNGGYAGHPQDPNARIGFSIKGVLKRSDFGITVGIPAPPSTMGVSDEVTFEIETELTGPALKAAAAPPSQ
jgi:polyisoprenoid-binding protein YceI